MNNSADAISVIWVISVISVTGYISYLVLVRWVKVMGFEFPVMGFEIRVSSGPGEFPVTMVN